VSAFPSLGPYAVPVCIGLVAVLGLVNLRGVKESGTVFAIPTYGFIAMVFAMLAWALVRGLSGHVPVAESASYHIVAQHPTTGLLALAIVLRAFSQGCTALTGVEAVSNGVPNFRPPKSRNAANTLSIMGVITIAMFAGITVLALAAQVHITDLPGNLVGAPAGYQQKTVIAQIAAATFGGSSPFFFLVQVFTAAILVLAANTAFNGFPILASLLGRDGFLPRQFSRRGDRLVYSNGIVILSLLTIALIWAFNASTDRLIQLYIIGVFVSFTLSQAGMVRHWNESLARERDPRVRRRIHRARAINGGGAALTALVLVVVLVTKFTHGAWIVVIAMPAVFLVMKAISRHYRRVAVELEPEPAGMTLPSRIHALVLVSKLHKPTLRALAFARATRPDTLTAITVATSQDEARALQEQWADRDIPVPLTVLESPYRDVTTPVLDYVARLRGANPRDVITIYIPEYVVGRWWEQVLHNQSALRLKARLLFERNVMVTSVPWQLESVPVEVSERVPS
jgi:amino acid transporter